jgi:cell division protein FtsB
VTARVNVITMNLEKVCLQKLSIDARIALEKFVELSDNYESSELENRNLRKENKILQSNVHNLRIHLDVANSLLFEMLKQLNRRINDISLQSDEEFSKKKFNFRKK